MKREGVIEVGLVKGGRDLKVGIIVVVSASVSNCDRNASISIARQKRLCGAKVVFCLTTKGRKFELDSSFAGASLGLSTFLKKDDSFSCDLALRSASFALRSVSSSLSICFCDFFFFFWSVSVSSKI